jgi:hypothetical protein
MTERCIQMAELLGPLRQFANPEDGEKIANILKAVRTSMWQLRSRGDVRLLTQYRSKMNLLKYDL